MRRRFSRQYNELLNLLLDDESPKALDMAEAILASAGKDGQLVYYQMGLHRQRAALFCEKGDRAAALRELGVLLACAEKETSAVPGEETFLIPTLGEDAPEERRRWVLEALEEEAFASLRETPELRALIARAGGREEK